MKSIASIVMAILLAGCATKPAGRPLPAREHRVRAKLTQSELLAHAKATAVDMVLVKPGTENAYWGGGSIIHEDGYILTCFHLSYGDTSSYDSLLYFDGAVVPKMMLPPPIIAIPGMGDPPHR